MPVLQVVENIEGSRFHGKYFAGIRGQEQGRGGPVLSSGITKAKIMSVTECQQIAKELSAWFTFKIVEG